ncbi:MAG: CRISPR system precrRNA processing endoribonuclease RAMP protein Cas6 [Promethearchaeota archaeon]
MNAILDSDNPILWDQNHPLLHFTFYYKAINRAEIPIFKADRYNAMIYTIIEDYNPKMAYQFHNMKKPKGWSFPPFKFESYRKSQTKGFYIVEKDTKFTWNFNTINPNIAKALISSKSIQFGKLKANLIKASISEKTYDFPPENFSKITIKIHSPVIFYRPTTKKYYEINEENILKWQLEKLKQLQFIKDYLMEELRPYIRIIKKDLTPFGLSYQLQDLGRIIRIEGQIGYITFKISGLKIIKENLWNIIHISQFIGLGSKTSMGFGHFSIISIK